MLLTIPVVAGGVLVWNWWIREVQRQDKIIATAIVILSGLILSLVWVVALSGFRWRRRVLIVASVVALAGIVFTSVRFTSVTGDLVPVFEWRWEPRPRIEDQRLTVSLSDRLEDESKLGAGSFPQFLGPSRDGIIEGVDLDQDWIKNPPRLLWRRTVGAGWAGFAISEGRAFTLEQHDDQEVICCYQLLSGELLWRHVYEARYDSPIGGLGPRTVPLVVGQRVYTLGATGRLVCLATSSGAVIWNREVLQENGAEVPAWGVACSPLFADGKIIVSAGGLDGRSLVAYDPHTGEQVWRGGDEPASYSSPVYVVLCGIPQILAFNQNKITSHNIEDGAVAWEYPWGNGHPHVALPVVVDQNSVLFSSGYGVGAQLLQLQRPATGEWRVECMWKSIRMKAKFANLIYKDGHVFGLDDGMLACIDLRDGSQRWKGGRYGHGQLLLVGEFLLVTTERGEVVLLKPTPDAPNEEHRFTAFDHKLWNPPALAGQVLLLRTDREAACYALGVTSMTTAGMLGNRVGSPVNRTD